MKSNNSSSIDTSKKAFKTYDDWININNREVKRSGTSQRDDIFRHIVTYSY